MCVLVWSTHVIVKIFGIGFLFLLGHQVLSIGYRHIHMQRMPYAFWAFAYSIALHSSAEMDVRVWKFAYFSSRHLFMTQIFF